MTKEEIISMLSKELNSEWTNGVTCLMVENSDSYIPVIVHHNKNELIVEVGEQDKKIYRIGRNMFNTTAECIVDSLMKKDNVICNEKDLQLGTEYIFPQIGVRLWRERAFHPKLLKDPLYMEEMQAVLEDEYQYQYFQMVTVIDWTTN